MRVVQKLFNIVQHSSKVVQKLLKSSSRVVQLTLIAVFLLTLLPQFVHAAAIDFSNKQVEYYTWNGFIPIRDAFERVAWIFGNNSYRGLFFVVTVAAILFGGMAAYLRLLTGMRGSVFGWAYPILIGVVIYLVFINPKWKVYIYDPVLNRNAVVGNVPMGVALPAGMLNYIERGFRDIIETSGNPLRYELNAGGVGVDVLIHALKYGLDTGDSYLNKTITRYIQDCVFLEIARPNSTINVNDLKGNTVDFLNDILKKAKNPAVYTLVYSQASPTGDVYACDDAYQVISNSLNNNTVWNNALTQLCKNVGIDAANINACVSSVDTGIRWLDTNGLWGLTAQGLMRQIYLGKMFADAAAQAAPGYEIALTKSTESNAMWITFNQWIPVVRAVVTAIALSMIPFLTLFIVTPVVGRALSLVLGMLLWITMFGIMDMIVHQIAVDMGINALEIVRARKLGLEGLFYLNDAGTKALAMFGYMRGTGMLFATIVTGMLVKFGGYALTGLSEGIMGRVQSGAGQAAQTTLTPEAPGIAQRREAMSWSFTTAMVNGYEAREWMRMGAQEMAVHDAVGKMTTREMIDSMGGMQGLINNSVYANVLDQHKRLVGARQTEKLINTVFGGDMKAYSEFLARGQTVDSQMANRLHALGFNNIQEGMTIKNFSFDNSGRLAFVQVSGRGANNTFFDNAVIDSKGNVVGGRMILPEAKVGNQSMQNVVLDMVGPGVARAQWIDPQSGVQMSGILISPGSSIIQDGQLNSSAQLSVGGKVYRTPNGMWVFETEAGTVITDGKTSKITDARFSVLDLKESMQDNFNKRLQAAKEQMTAEEVDKTIKAMRDKEVSSGKETRYSDKISNEVSQAVVQTLLNDQKFRKSFTTEQLQKLEAGVSTEGGVNLLFVKAKAHGGYTVSVGTKSGQTVEFDVSKQDKEQFDRIYRQASEQVLSKYAKESEAARLIRDAAKEAKAGNVERFVESYEALHQVGLSQTSKLNAEFANFVAGKLGYSTDAAGLVNTVSWINNASAKAGTAEYQQLQSYLNEFYQSKLSGIGNTTVQNINQIQADVNEKTGALTTDVNKSLATPLPHVRLDAPSLRVPDKNEFNRDKESFEKYLGDHWIIGEVGHIPIVGTLAGPAHHAWDLWKGVPTLDPKNTGFNIPKEDSKKFSNAPEISLAPEVSLSRPSKEMPTTDDFSISGREKGSGIRLVK
jgi:hypothetical protein